MAKGFAAGIGSTAGLLNQALAYRNKANLNAGVDARNAASAAQARALAAQTQPMAPQVSAPETDGSHDYLGEHSDAFPDGFTSYDPEGV